MMKISMRTARLRINMLSVRKGTARAARTAAAVPYCPGFMLRRSIRSVPLLAKKSGRPDHEHDDQDDKRDRVLPDPAEEVGGPVLRKAHQQPANDRSRDAPE